MPHSSATWNVKRRRLGIKMPEPVNAPNDPTACRLPKPNGAEGSAGDGQGEGAGQQPQPHRGQV